LRPSDHHESSVSVKKLRFQDLCERHHGLTPAISAFYSEAAGLCLGRHYASPQTILLRDGTLETQSSAEWNPADQRTIDAWANQDDATEFGAYGLALAAAEVTRGLVAVRRAETRTGADYYLGPPNEMAEDLESSFRLEVSGTDLGTDAVIETRLIFEDDSKPLSIRESIFANGHSGGWRSKTGYSFARFAKADFRDTSWS
jgi:hypothetical protein